MPESMPKIEKEFGNLTISMYENGKTHRCTLSINHGQIYYENIMKQKAIAIIDFFEYMFNHSLPLSIV